MGTLRIIGGAWRSRKINFPDQPHLRPTHDRIRETLFNWLAPYIADSSCLDLFAGSGALGFEALSRGARHVCFVDINGAVIQSLQQNAQKLSISKEKFIIRHGNFLESNFSLPFSHYDIIFIDPPFHQGMVPASINWLIANALLKTNSLIYIETEKKLLPLPIPAEWQIVRQKKTATLCYSLIKTVALK